MIRDDKRIIEVCSGSNSMAEAAAILNIHFRTLKRHAERLNCYKPNQSGKGLAKNRPRKKELNDILAGNHPEFQTFKLKNRLLEEGLMKNICSECELTEWRNKPLNMELDHIDGDRTNHRRENLRLLCPNCHAQTDTYRAKNIKNL